MKLFEINIYPVKSLKGIGLQESSVEGRGLRFDRRWMLVDENNRFLTQREHPKMALFETTLHGGQLEVSFNGSGLPVPTGEADGQVDVEIWKDTVTVSAFGQNINRWFSDILGTECRLVAMPETTRRTVNSEYAVRPDEDIVSFADGYPFLLIGEGSLADLNSRLDKPVPMNRFRPNFVVSGSEAFAEDTWKRIRIGEAEFHVVKPCARCVITTVDQATGEKTGKEPLKTLSSYRSVGGNVMFGQNLIAEKSGGTVRVGDEIEVLELR